MNGLKQAMEMIRSIRLWWRRALLIALALAVVLPPLTSGGCDAPRRSEPLEARLELAAGRVEVEQAGVKGLVFSGTALLPDAVIETGVGARALVRLSNGSAVFLRGGSGARLGSGLVDLTSGELWLDAPPTERDSIAIRLGDITVHAVDAGVSIRRTGDGAVVYAARGTATVTAKGGRVEVQAGEQAVVAGASEPRVEPVAFWEDWTGGMADHALMGGMAGAGSGRIYGGDIDAPNGSPARTLEISRQSVRAVIRAGLAETEVDQTFFNPGDRAVEGWYWFSVPAGASVTGFAVETNGVLVEGEFIEKREAAAQYGRAVASGHDPALLEWIDARTFRARIYPVPATGTRRVVLRYLQLLPANEGILRYLYPLQSKEPVRIGEFSLSVNLGEEGREMQITTLAEARVEDGGRLVTVRRSGYVPRADFLLEARLDTEPEPVRVSRAAAGGDTADYVMVRYTPDIDWLQAGELRGEVVVVVDTSAAGDESSRAVKAAAAEAILRALSSDDRFALVSLDVRPTVLHPEEGLAPASEEEIAKALERLAEHASGGATDLSALFDVSLARLHGGEQPAVIYVGDGIATSGEMSGEKLAERLRRALSTSRARLFTVGVGPHADHALLATMAQAGGGRAFQIDSSQEATERALDLVATLKTPTMTDFEIDLGAGLDEVLISANGKVVNGEEVVVLARTHHDLPRSVTVKGRLGGKEFEKSHVVSQDERIVAGFVPRLWAAEYLRRMIGSAGDPAVLRGKVMQMGIQYGLMTPYTSILALESEQAYQQQGIPRRRSSLRGPRLGALVRPRQTSLARQARNAVGFGCEASYEPASSPVAQEAVKVKDQAYAHKPAPAPAAEMTAGLRMEEKVAMRPGKSRKRVSRPTRVDDVAPVEGEKTPAADRPARPRARGEQVLRTCSDAARRPLCQRVIIWRKRIRTARGPQDLVHRFQAAWHACELPDWRSEATFLRVLQPAIRDEGAASYVLHFFENKPEVQRYLARLILRRAVDPRIVKKVEEILFKGRINWANADIELSEIPDVQERLARLREIMARAPGDPNGIIRMVHLLVQADKMEEALVLGRRLRDSGLTTPFLARELGDVLARHELDDEAVRTYSEIVEFDPGSLQSRRLLGDIYLAHGWYDPAYRQYKTMTERAPAESVFRLRLAAAAAGAGRVDEALRLERKVARAPGRPGPEDPRRWARLWSAARLARMLQAPPKSSSPGRLAESLESKLKELQLFRGPGTLVLLTWEDLSADLELSTYRGDKAVATGEATDAARVGINAVLLSGDEPGQLVLRAHLRSPAAKYPIRLKRQDITFDGRNFKVAVGEHVMPAGASRIDL